MKRTLLLITTLLCTSTASAYDITVNMGHADYTDATGYKIYYGKIKGGPYPNYIPCGKPPLKLDGTIDCPGIGLEVKPIFAVAVAIYGDNQESGYSNEVFYQPPVGVPNIRSIIKKQ